MGAIECRVRDLADTMGLSAIVRSLRHDFGPVYGLHTLTWQMTNNRDTGTKTEAETEQIVLGRYDDEWRVLFRHIRFDVPSVLE